MKKLKIDLEKLNDDNIDLIRTIKNSNFTNGHKFKQCYFEVDKKIPYYWVCNLPCDRYCPDRIKIECRCGTVVDSA